MRVLIQVPEGLKTKMLDIADEFEDSVIDCEACYGACDIKENLAKKLKCEKIIHYGHNEFVKSKIPVEYREMRIKVDFSQILEKNLEKLPKKIGLITSVQFLDSIEEVKKFLEAHGKIAVIGGQILGCDVSSGKKIEKEVDAFLYFGSGQFHALGLAMKTKKSVYVLNYEMKTLEKMDISKFQKQRDVAVALAKDAEKFGILVSSKKGQMNIKLAEKIKEKLKPKKSYVLIMDEIRPEKLEGVGVDSYINTACPRIAIDNRAEFKKPIVNWDEIKQIFK